MTPFFTILIPCYNSAAYIDATLKSLYNQTYKDFEVLVIDDRSTDESVAISQECIGKYGLNGRVLVRPADLEKGVASCRNYGAANARGKWLSFLDSDDLFCPDKLQLVHELINRNADECKIYFHGTRNFEDETNKTLQIILHDWDERPRDILPQLLKRNVVVTSAVTINKDFLTSLGGFDASLHGVEDYMLWLKVAKHTRWCYCPRVLTEYRVRNTSLMGGREMAHYVQQNMALLKKVKQSNEFSGDEVRQIDKYFFADLMPYYAMVSLDGRGWGDFTRGIIHLILKGKPAFGLKLYMKFLKRHILSLAVKKRKN